MERKTDPTRTIQAKRATMERKRDRDRKRMIREVAR